MNLENAHALLIGVGGDLPITIDDANAIAKVLGDNNKAAYDPKNVILLTEKNATRENVLSELQNIVEKVKNIEDATVVIFYSGHGGKYRGSNGSDYYLLTNGYDPYDRDNTMIKGDEFSELINSIEANRLLVMLDCCHAAGIIDEKPLIKLKSADEQIVNSNIEILKKLKSGTGKVFITSCDDDEQSVILPDSKNSLFTEVVLEALEGYASNGEEYVGIIDILYYVLRQIPKRIEAYNHIQRPIINKIDDLSSDFFICKVAKYLQTDEFRSKSNPVDKSQLEKLANQFNIENCSELIVISNNGDPIEVIEDTTLKSKTLKEIESLITQGETEKAISQFVDITKTQLVDYKNQSHLLAYKYNVLLNDKMMDGIDDQTYRKELTKIAQALHFFIEKAEKDLNSLTE
ncbi:caspase family protein [Aquimarina megaterium]|uniref:caspase family protein n=1 Tax=Aquimarina megaterium TaxID=1443666 RepID=UPI0009449CF5|nr:caspase family protein [Aquimarina megaterium]